MTVLTQAAWLIQYSSFFVLLFLLPFSKSAIEITFGFLLLGWVLDRLNPATRTNTVWARPSLWLLSGALGAYLLVCFLSIFWSDFPQLSLRGFVGKWLEYLLLFMIIADVGSRPGIARRAVWIVAASSLCVALQGVGQELNIPARGYEYLAKFVYRRMTGPYQNPIDLATYLMVVIPVLLGFLMSQRGLKRGGLGLLVMVLIVCVARTEALGAWLGLGLAFIVMVSMHSSLRRVGWVALAALVLCAGVFLQRLNHLRDVTSLSDIGKVDRWMMWQAAVGMIRDRPVTGHGLNTFMANYLHYWVGGERQPRYAHNCYLQVAAETGIVGALLFIGLLGLIFAKLLGAIRRLRSDDSLLLLGLVAGLLAFVVQAGIDTNFYSLRQAALFWTLSGLALGMSQSAPQSLRTASTTIT